MILKVEVIKMRTYLISLLIILTLTSCGGGNDGASTGSPVVAQATIGGNGGLSQKRAFPGGVDNASCNFDTGICGVNCGDFGGRNSVVVYLQNQGTPQQSYACQCPSGCISYSSGGAATVTCTLSDTTCGF